MRHKCFPTFDYELYLGPETGTVENCLIKPIEALLSVFDKYGAKGTFFVDCAYLYKLNELRQKHTSLQQDYDMVSENLKMLAANGHEIQMHFHPQWLYSDYVNGKWKLDFEHYKLSDVEPDYLEKSFGESRKMLESIIGKEICAYRAGGYCLSDYDDFVRLFRDNHISIDRDCRKLSEINLTI